MKIVTVLGTRPEIIRLSVLVRKLDSLCDHVLVHTGQNSDPGLSDLFFRELGVRSPDVFMGVDTSSPGRQIGRILEGTEGILLREAPDRMLVLGDTNSALSVFMAKRMGIPVFHMEAGNRCFDDRVPEEINRRVVDACSDVLLPYTAGSRENLLAEGIPSRRIVVTGNPILEVMKEHAGLVEGSGILGDLGLSAHEYFLVTAHRAENVDDPARLGKILDSLVRVAEEWGLPVVVSVHPRTRARIESLGGFRGNSLVRLMEPFGFPDFVQLEKNARCVLTDSGTVQEECCILRVANVTIRDVTERPETVACGSNILSGVEPENVMRCVGTALRRSRDWTPPEEYTRENVSDTVASVMMARLINSPGS
jgi:UDP-N-acetylglucosamine 2-epimerase (non-hydrolysing)